MLIGSCSQTVRGTFLEVFELESFPFDCQHFKIKMIFTESDEVFQLHPAAHQANCAMMTQDPKLLPEYNFIDPVLESGRTSVRKLQDDFSYADLHHPTLLLCLRARRTWGSHVNKSVTTLALVSLAVIPAFMIPSEDLSDRLAHVTTLFLTAVAYQLVVSSSLPNLEYMTLMDKYILTLNVYMLMAMGIIIAVVLKIKFEHEPESWQAQFLTHLDQYAGLEALATWLGMHAMLALGAMRARMGRENDKLMSVGWLDEHEETAVLAANSKYSVTKSGSTIFVGSPAMYQQVTQAKGDFTFWCGTWYSEDFYGPHGIEYVFISVVCDEQGQLQLMARKITGDANVPCGRITWQTTAGLPSIGGGEALIKIQVRGNIRDKEGFEWIDPYGGVVAKSSDELQIGHATFFRLDREQPEESKAIVGSHGGNEYRALE